MNTIRNDNEPTFFRNVCIVMIWCMTIYSSTIQYVFFQISYGMLLLGGAVLISYGLANSGKPFVFREAMTEEDIILLFFMVYILFAGLLFAPNRNNHTSQWVTCLEYLFIEIVIASIIKSSGTDAFHMMLLANSVLLAVVFLKNPVDHMNTGRYTISQDVNPNSLGLGFVAGIWAVLYGQVNKKRPLILTSLIVGVLGYCILLTGSRKSLIAAGLTIILWLLFCYLPGLKGKSAWSGILSFLIIIIIAIIMVRIFAGFYLNSTTAARMDKLFYEASEGNRSNMYREGFELIKRNPLFGIGFQGFKYYYVLYSHATLIEIPVSGGIIGSILYFSVYFISLKRLINSYKRTKNDINLYKEHIRVKMLLILWTVMVFFTICIIHPYQFDSGINFGIVFGESAYIERKLNSLQKKSDTKKIGSKYIRYEKYYI